MTDRFVTRGFVGRQHAPDRGQRIPPGQYVTDDFPVLSAGPTPRTPLADWSFRIDGLVTSPVEWTWQEFTALPARDYVVDIHCVTKWTKLDTHWRGVSVDTLFDQVELDRRAAFVIAYCDGGYTTNLPIADVVNEQAFVGYTYGGDPLPAEHGGPARLVVPARYFWKSAKWIRGLRLQSTNEPGFWESLGYHIRGDQWLEERYSGD